MSTELLQGYLSDSRQSEEDFPSVVGAILKDNIRPLFAKSKTPTVTSQGRKNIRTVHAASDSTLVDPGSKPWKYHHPYIVSVFRWLLRNLNVRVCLKV